MYAIIKQKRGQGTDMKTPSIKNARTMTNKKSIRVRADFQLKSSGYSAKNSFV